MYLGIEIGGTKLQAGIVDARGRVKQLERVAVENDANCAGFAEALLGAGRGQARVFYFNVGTGIGGALVVDGELYNGRFGAMELGHVRIAGAASRGSGLQPRSAGPELPDRAGSVGRGGTFFASAS